MDSNVHIVLDSFIDLLSMVLCTVHEESTDDTLTNVCIVVVLINTQLFVVYINLDPLEQAS
jgi:hypothetical protein